MLTCFVIGQDSRYKVRRHDTKIAESELRRRLAKIAVGAGPRAQRFHPPNQSSTPSLADQSQVRSYIGQNVCRRVNPVFSGPIGDIVAYITEATHF